MRFIRLLLATICIAAFMACPVQAGDIQGAEILCSTANVTLTTTSETAIITSNPLSKKRIGSSYFVVAWAQLTTGTATTTVTPRLRRGTDTSGTVVGEANAITVGAAAGSNETFDDQAQDTPGDVAFQQYTLTLQQASATGNGTSLNACISVQEVQ